LLVDVLFVGLYNPIVAARMPKMIYDVRVGDYTLLRGRLSLYFDTSTALGMQMAVQCNEEIPFSDPQEAYQVAQGVKPQIATFFPTSVQPLFRVCEAWGLSPPEPIENQAISSDLPALIFAGEFDPITPPDWGRLAAGSLSQATFYEFPGNGHWVTRSSSCAQEVMLGFLQAPERAPDLTCLHSLERLGFAGN
jgi:pimeloyl-ACP methyl ester carboxylesterase